MAKNKIGLEFTGFEELIERLDASGGDVKEAVNKSLEVANKTISKKLSEDMKKHHQTGDTEKSIIANAQVEWEGLTASIGVGFDIKNKGLPSIFLMYGTPRSKPDKRIYNDIYGSKTRKEIAQKQEKIFLDMIAKKLGG